MTVRGTTAGSAVCRAIVCVALAIAVGVQISAPAGAQDDTPDPNAVPDDLGASAASAPLLRLVDQTPAVTGNGVYEAVVDVGGVPGDVELVVNVLDRIVTGDQLRQTAGGRGLGTALATVPPKPITEFTRNANGSLSVLLDLNDGTIPSEPGQVRLRAAGVYPVLFELRTKVGLVLDRMVTHLIRLPEPGDLSTIEVAVALDVGAAPGHRPDGLVGFSNETRDRLTVFVDAMDRNPDVPVTLTIVPETLATLHESTNPTDHYLAGRLVDRAEQRLVLDSPYVRVDGSSLIAAGLDTELRSLEVTGASVLEELLGRPPRDLTWLAPDRVSPAEVRRRFGAGVREFVIPARAMVDPDPSAPIPLGPIELELSSGRTVAAVEVNEGFRSYFDADDPVLAAETLIAELWLLAFRRSADDSEGGVVITAPSSWEPNPAFLSRLLGGLARTPGLTPVHVDDIFDLDPALDGAGIPYSRALVGRITPALDVDLDAWRLTHDRLAAFGSMVVDAAGLQIVADLDAHLLPSFSADLNDTDREQYWVAARLTVDQHLAGIAAPPSRSFTLTSREDEIPLRFRNDGSLALRVKVRLTSDKLEFPAGVDESVILPAGEVIDVPIDVRVKTSGAFPVEVLIETADGSMPLDESRITIRSTVLSGLGVVITATAFALLGLWWLIDHRRRRAGAPTPAW